MHRRGGVGALKAELGPDTTPTGLLRLARARRRKSGSAGRGGAVAVARTDWNGTPWMEHPCYSFLAHGHPSHPPLFRLWPAEAKSRFHPVQDQP